MEALLGDGEDPWQSARVVQLLGKGGTRVSGLYVILLTQLAVQHTVGSHQLRPGNKDAGSVWVQAVKAVPPDTKLLEQNVASPYAQLDSEKAWTRMKDLANNGNSELSEVLHSLGWNGSKFDETPDLNRLKDLLTSKMPQQHAESNLSGIGSSLGKYRLPAASGSLDRSTFADLVAVAWLQQDTAFGDLVDLLQLLELDLFADIVPPLVMKALPDGDQDHEDYAQAAAALAMLLRRNEEAGASSSGPQAAAAALLRAVIVQQTKSEDPVVLNNTERTCLLSMLENDRR